MKKPIKEDNTYAEYYCGHCECNIDSLIWEYCPYCGTEIDWSDHL